MAKLTDFMVSRVRTKLLQAFLLNPAEIFYVRQLTRITNEEINAVRRELERMKLSGMVAAEHRGNRLYYHFKTSYPFYQDLLSLVNKTSGLGKNIIKSKAKLGQVKFAMLSGKYARGIKSQEDDIDLLLVGKIILPQLSLIARQNEAETKREINYTVMAEDELKYRKSRRDPFILSILSQSRIMLIGDEHELVS